MLTDDAPVINATLSATGHCESSAGKVSLTVIVIGVGILLTIAAAFVIK